ncbi:MAG: hypothetical protein JJT78_09665 [Leptospira sp.]|nr:hypothetical protein [Leptospira sp.]
MDNNNQRTNQIPIEMLYAEYKASGMTRPEYCRAKGISFEHFRSRITKMNRDNLGRSLFSNEGKNFSLANNPFRFEGEESNESSRNLFSFVIELGDFKFQIQLEGVL